MQGQSVSREIVLFVAVWGRQSNLCLIFVNSPSCRAVIERDRKTQHQSVQLLAWSQTGPALAFLLPEASFEFCPLFLQIQVKS